MADWLNVAFKVEATLLKQVSTNKLLVPSQKKGVEKLKVLAENPGEPAGA